LQTVDFSINRDVGITRGGGAAKRHRSVPMLSTVVCAKLLDSASTALFNAALGAVPEAAEVTISCCKAGEKGKPEAYMVITLKDVLCTEFGFGGGGGNPTESLALDWSEIDIEYKGYDEKGGVKPARVHYNMNTASAE
jgi:type VI protein secretion system component Hcp